MFTSARQIEKFVNDQVRIGTKYAKLQGWVKEDWFCDVRVSVSAHRNRSWGGTRRARPFISIAASRFLRADVLTFREYKSFEKDPVIGSFSGQAERALAKLVFHEIGHTIQWSSADRASAAFGSYGQINVRGHGELWKSLYRSLLKALWVNTIYEDLPAPSAAEVLLKASCAPVERKQNELSRDAIRAMVKQALIDGLSCADVIRRLVNNFGYKKTTATSYVYQFKKQLMA